MLKKVEEEKLFNFLYSHARNIQKCLQLTHYRLFFDDTSRKKCAIKNAAMTINVDFQYLEADISVKESIKDCWKLKDYNVIINTLIHEICHILIDELYGCYEDEVKRNEKKGVKLDYDSGNFYRERTTEHISRWGARLYQDFMDINNINLKTGKCIPISKKKKSLKV